MKQSQILELIERIGNLLRAEQRIIGSAQQLQPVHIQVLEYLNRCNKYSNTPAGVVKYFGITKGTVSQSINVLEKRSLVEKKTDLADKRSVHIIITAKGKKLLKTLLIKRSSFELAKNTDSKINNLVETELKNILANLQKHNSYNTFGVCRTCRHLITKQTGFRCGLTKEVLSSTDTTKICHEHEYSEAV